MIQTLPSDHLSAAAIQTLLGHLLDYVLKQQLAAKFDRSPQSLNRLDRLDSEQLSSLSIALLSFGELADFERWLRANGVE
jgi:Domain of unknown function (DUF4351)